MRQKCHNTCPIQIPFSHTGKTGSRKTKLRFYLQNMQSWSDMNWDLSFCVKLISTKNMKTLWDAPGAKCPFHSRESLLFIAFATLFEINTKNAKIHAWHIQDLPQKIANRISRTMLGGHILGPKWLKVVQICPSSQSFFWTPCRCLDSEKWFWILDSSMVYGKGSNIFLLQLQSNKQKLQYWLHFCKRVLVQKQPPYLPEEYITCCS